jgi:F0F1-type ATP synthase membrane subunit c/vacuolar-type H+-ATPase subunit K
MTEDRTGVVVGLVTAAFASVVFVAAMLLLANALIGDWLLAVLATVAAGVVFTAVFASFARWARRNPERAEKMSVALLLGPATMHSVHQRPGGTRRDD